MDFFHRYKKIFQITGFLLVCVFLGYVIYSFFFKNTFSQKIEEEKKRVQEEIAKREAEELKAENVCPLVAKNR